MITKYIIVDDEHIAHDVIKGYCDQLPSFQLMKNCYDAIEALEYLTTNTVDLIFLDLNMPRLKGFDFLKTLSHPPKVIVTTAYKEYALEGYELNIVDYLLKPFSFERFIKAINKAIQPAPGNTYAERNTTIGNEKTDNRIFLYNNKTHFQIDLDNLQFIEAAGNNIKIVLNDETIEIREKLSSILEFLPSKSFIQVHRSFIVSLNQIKSVKGNEIYLAQHKIPIGKMYKVKLNEFLSS